MKARQQARRVTHGILRACIVCLVFFFAARVHAQISPGPLARAHQSLDGAANCTKCHQVSTSSPSFRCLECHREIAAEVQQHRGLHSTFPQAGPIGAACVKCHSDHNGVDFKMLHWDPTTKGFDHAKTGFALDGKHAGVQCRTCHAAQHISAQARPLLTAKDLNHTWLGLLPACTTCHVDKHEGRLGPNCARCHSTTDWKPTSIDRQNFDHSATRFPLTGEHRTVQCQGCHTPGLDGQPRYAGIAFANCADCHKDPHKGAFKQGCDSCHNTFSWTKSSFTSTFDHSKTQFPLLGKHLNVPCLTCHRGGNFKAPIAHTACASCHTPDPHGDQFLRRPDGDRCEACHTVDGWSPSTFSIADHAKTSFPLIFPHAAVKCASCHLPAGTHTQFKLNFALCIDCHKDEHLGQFADAPWHNRCEQCHTGATFHTSTYTLAKHQKSSFPLTGGHEAVACNECHKPSPDLKATPYHFKPLRCTTCHEDVHKGQFAARMSALDASGKPFGCEACHSTKEWKDLSKFNHDKTNFPLTGSHRAVACADCHKPPNLELTLEHVRFATASGKCKDCHQNDDPHAEQFGARESDCASCHTTTKWRPSLFDHDKTQFPLRGGHEQVACSACHSLKREVRGKPVLFYKPTPTACEACHSGTIPKNDPSHAPPPHH